jgi:hypothetical protein
MAYHMLLTNSIGKTKDLTTRNTLFNIHYQKLIRGKGKAIENIFATLISSVNIVRSPLT